MPYAANNGTKIYWEQHGAGEPLLLIMGLGFSLDMWLRATPLFSGHYRTIVFDNRGVGRSDVPPGPYSIAEMARDAAAVLDAAGAGGAHVFGVSMGGLIAQELALQSPDRVRSLVLGCTFCGGPKAVQADPGVLTALMSITTMPPERAFEAVVPILFDPDTPRERIDEAREMRLRHYPTREGFVAQVMAIGAYQSCNRLSGISVPTLVIHGETDVLVPPQNAKLLAQSIPGAKLVMIPHGAHVFLSDQPEASFEAILSFLAGQSARELTGSAG